MLLLPPLFYTAPVEWHLMFISFTRNDWHSSIFWIKTTDWSLGKMWKSKVQCNHFSKGERSFIDKVKISQCAVHSVMKLSVRKFCWCKLCWSFSVSFLGYDLREALAQWKSGESQCQMLIRFPNQSSSVPAGHTGQVSHTSSSLPSVLNTGTTLQRNAFLHRSVTKISLKRWSINLLNCETSQLSQKGEGDFPFWASLFQSITECWKEYWSLQKGQVLTAAL